MEKPKIEINGMEIEPAEKISVNTWRKVMELESKYKTIQPLELVDGISGALAEVYKVSAEEIMNSLEVDELVSKYFEVYEYLIYLLFSKVQPTKQAE